MDDEGVMSTHTTTVNGCEITVSTICDPYDEIDTENEGFGYGRTTFQRSDLERIEGREVELWQVNGSGAYVSTNVIEETLSEYDIEDDDQWTELEISNADYAIALLWALFDLGQPFSVSFESEGSAFWFFHDLGHVANDAEEYGPGAVFFSGLSAEAEDAAHLFGARAALKSGACDLAEVLRETIGVGGTHRERFGQESGAVEDILGMVSGALGVSLADQLSEAL